MLEFFTNIFSGKKCIPFALGYFFQILSLLPCMSLQANEGSPRLESNKPKVIFFPQKHFIVGLEHPLKVFMEEHKKLDAIHVDSKIHQVTANLMKQFQSNPEFQDDIVLLNIVYSSQLEILERLKELTLRTQKDEKVIIFKEGVLADALDGFLYSAGMGWLNRNKPKFERLVTAGAAIELKKLYPKKVKIVGIEPDFSKVSRLQKKLSRNQKNLDPISRCLQDVSLQYYAKSLECKHFKHNFREEYALQVMDQVMNSERKPTKYVLIYGAAHPFLASQNKGISVQYPDVSTKKPSPRSSIFKFSVLEKSIERNKATGEYDISANRQQIKDRIKQLGLKPGIGSGVERLIHSPEFWLLTCTLCGTFAMFMI